MFTYDGIHYLSFKESGLIFVAATRDNVLPAMILELLRSMASIIKDYCGTVSEESLRKNFILVYELFDEVLDYGVPQTTASETLKDFVFNEPVIVPPPGIKIVDRLPGGARGPTGVYKTVLDTARQEGVRGREEIFVDIVETLACVWSAN